ncbi:hypothetical protein PPERSA_03849 [Pseudocohnilembus persalinus]|uniref:Uncharacterized protein n=1 Tax=Pseudocohnilembus persalinus TaxID=266149 RepID=A0A0V0QVE0_PSEPJ|nr:hypothetical protein PPERSA_03849 [Pseudocohnilembus persalinus]|eukprot:KRX05912.1 hypothetical protein PPERSA_03849 [Pseudocohnilembus persalinus]
MDKLYNTYCKKSGHQNFQYQFVNFDSASKNDFLQCQACVLEQSHESAIQKKLLFQQIIDNKIKEKDLINWPPNSLMQKQANMLSQYKQIQDDINNKKQIVSKYYNNQIKQYYDNIQSKVIKSIKKQQADSKQQLNQLLDLIYAKQYKINKENQKQIQDIKVETFRQHFINFVENKLDYDNLFNQLQIQLNQNFQQQQQNEQLNTNKQEIEVIQYKLDQMLKNVDIQIHIPSIQLNDEEQIYFKVLVDKLQLGNQDLYFCLSNLFLNVDDEFDKKYSLNIKNCFGQQQTVAFNVSFNLSQQIFEVFDDQKVIHKKICLGYKSCEKWTFAFLLNQTIKNKLFLSISNIEIGNN